MKKVLSLILATSMVVGLASCGSKKEATSGDGTLTWWCKNNANAYIDSYNKIEAFKLMGEKAGVKIDFQHPVVGQDAEQFNTLVASGEYPDLIEYDWSKYPGGASQAVSDGVIISLDDYITEDKMPNLTKLLKERPDFAKVIKDADGKIDLFPSFVEDQNTNSFIGPTIRKDWLDKLGLEMPVTIDDWHNVLTAIKTGDPNGNGQADEVPLVDDSSASFGEFAAAFGASTGMSLDTNGNVVYSPMTEEYKNYLTTMAQWYDEGLIDHDYASQERKNIDYKMTSDIGGAYVGYTGSQMGNYLKSKEGDTTFKLAATSWPVGADGKAYCGNPSMIQIKDPNSGLAITTSCKDVDAAIKAIDWLYGDEGRIARNYGIEGKSYTKTGDDIQFTDDIMNNKDGKDPVAALAPYAIPIWGFCGSMMMKDSYDKISRSYDEQREAAAVWADCDTSILLPNLSFTNEESTTISDSWNDLWTCTQEFSTKVITGSESIDDFDKYVSNLKSMGVQKVVDAYKAAYDRYKKN